MQKRASVIGHSLVIDNTFCPSRVFAKEAMARKSFAVGVEGGS